MIKLDRSPQRAGIDSALPVDDIGFRVEDFYHSAKPRHSFLELLVKHDERPNGSEIHVDVKDKSDRIAGAERPPYDVDAARNERHEIEHALHELVEREVLTHEEVHALLGMIESFIPVMEFFHLNLLVRERLNRANAGQTVLDDGVDLGDFAAIVHEDVRHFRAIAEHEYDEKNRETE